MTNCHRLSIQSGPAQTRVLIGFQDPQTDSNKVASFKSIQATHIVIQIQDKAYLINPKSTPGVTASKTFNEVTSSIYKPSPPQHFRRPGPQVSKSCCHFLSYPLRDARWKLVLAKPSGHLVMG